MARGYRKARRGLNLLARELGAKVATFQALAMIEEGLIVLAKEKCD